MVNPNVKILYIRNINRSRKGEGMVQKNYKRFNVNSKNDYLIYLRFITSSVHTNIKRYNLYIEQLGEKIKELDLYNNQHKKIDSFIYEEFRDKIHAVSIKLKNLFGDNANDALSYYKFRKKLVKNNVEVSKVLGDMSENLKRNLNDVNELRNWGLHEPESLLNAHLENIDVQWPKHEVIYYKTNFNPIMIHVFEKYEGKWLISLYEESKNMSQLYLELYESMLNDYQLLINSKLQIIEILNKNRPFEGEIELPITSFEMQKRKYKK